MRSVAKTAAAALVAALSLAGCAGGADDSASPAPLVKGSVTVDLAELPTLSGAYGEQPTIAFPLKPGFASPSPTPTEDLADATADLEAGAETAETASDTENPSEDTSASPSATPSEEPSPYLTPPSKLQAQVQEGMAGDGPEVKAENLVSVDLIAWEWGETEPSYAANTFLYGSPLVFAVRSDNTTLSGVARVVVGQRVGSRVMGVIPPTEGALPTALGFDAGATVVVCVDIREQFSKDLQAQKDAERTGAEVGPQISGGLGGPASVGIPGGLAEPTEISLTVIATGTGPVIEDGQQVLVHYSATDWSGQTDGDTWTSGWGPQAVTVSADPMGDGSVLDAFSLLVGVPVGSRVLILTPGKEGSYQADAIVLDVVQLVQGNDDAADADAADDADDADGADGAAGDASPSPSETASESPSATSDGG